MSSSSMLKTLLGVMLLTCSAGYAQTTVTSTETQKIIKEETQKPPSPKVYYPERSHISATYKSQAAPTKDQLLKEILAIEGQLANVKKNPEKITQADIHKIEYALVLKRKQLADAVKDSQE
ncbi:MAG: hypothetical protein GY751_24485 [Bacteroidetes bacterium]|nr:hypothetical protein [Bacteroidota bacterium]